MGILQAGQSLSAGVILRRRSYRSFLLLHYASWAANISCRVFVSCEWTPHHLPFRLLVCPVQQQDIMKEMSWANRARINLTLYQPRLFVCTMLSMLLLIVSYLCTALFPPLSGL